MSHALQASVAVVGDKGGLQNVVNDPWKVRVHAAVMPIATRSV